MLRRLKKIGYGIAGSVERHSCPLPLTVPFVLILQLSKAGRMIFGGAADQPRRELDAGGLEAGAA